MRPSQLIGVGSTKMRIPRFRSRFSRNDALLALALMVRWLTFIGLGILGVMFIAAQIHQALS